MVRYVQQQTGMTEPDARAALDMAIRRASAMRLDNLGIALDVEAVAQAEAQRQNVHPLLLSGDAVARAVAAALDAVGW